MMGMFDSFYAKAKCPYCKIEKEMEFQSKRGANKLLDYHIGDKVHLYFITIKDGSLRDGLAICDCGKATHADIVISNNIFVGLKKIRKNAV